MPDSPTTEPESAFVCDCTEWARSACAGEPFYKELEGRRYCVFHLPSFEKMSDFEKALQKKLETGVFNFQGVWFPDTLSCPDFRFNNESDFSNAVFNGDANFRRARFGGNASFSHAHFHGDADFSFAEFDGSELLIRRVWTCNLH
jgi:uncharacterized protein YjbI with pentapeptide repeats